MNKAVPICFIALVALAFISFPLFCLALVIMVIVAGIGAVQEDNANRAAALRSDHNLKQKLHTHLDSIKNSDGKPDLPFDPK